MLDEHIKYPKWQKPYLEALMEFDRNALSKKIGVAEAAVSRRSRELTTIAWDIDEHHALRDAAFRLHLFKGRSVKS